MSYEIEIKSLLGSKENAEALLERMKKLDPNLKSFDLHKQLNHYFEGGDLNKVAVAMSEHLTSEQAILLQELAKKSTDYSLRTRWADGKVIFVLKASVDDTTSSNGTARREFEAQVDMSLEDLDKIILDAGFKYLSKWSRERTEYACKNSTVTIDKNAGYGYLAEFERVEDSEDKAEAAKSDLRALMQELEVEELNQDRLARMFDFYNNNWPDYYGTDKVFNIE